MNSVNVLKMYLQNTIFVKKSVEVIISGVPQSSILSPLSISSFRNGFSYYF